MIKLFLEKMKWALLDGMSLVMKKKPQSRPLSSPQFISPIG